jgi:hypothetical protein
MPLLCSSWQPGRQYPTSFTNKEEKSPMPNYVNIECNYWISHLDSSKAMNPKIFSTWRKHYKVPWN